MSIGPDSRAFVGVACDIRLAPEFQAGGQYEGQVLEVSQEHAATAVLVLEKANYQSSGHRATGLGDVNSLLINISNTSSSEPRLESNSDEGKSVISVGLMSENNAINAAIGKGVQEVLDQEERGTRLSLIKTIGAAPILALASIIGHPGVGVEAFQHVRRLQTIKEGSKLNQARRRDAASLARLLPPIVEIK